MRINVKTIVKDGAFQKAALAVIVVTLLSYLFGSNFNPVGQQLMTLLPASVAFTSIGGFGMWLGTIVLVLFVMMLVNAIRKFKYVYQLLLTTIMIVVVTIVFNVLWDVNNMAIVAVPILFAVVYLGNSLKK